MDFRQIIKNCVLPLYDYVIARSLYNVNFLARLARTIHEENSEAMNASSISIFIAYRPHYAGDDR
jgi:hypothetical protein